MLLTPGTRLAEYEIVDAIGAGGMGEVYRARDTKLGREVAIKILPEAFASDRERLARFEREARLLASLNHPGIATLHGSATDNGVRFLVMELVDGETLEERIQRGPLTADEAVPLFAQIAEAMEAAHNKGVIHRDLKPANIKITPDGRPKILDFGLAKGGASEAAETGISESPTLTHRGTSAGIILGTAPYMSPEQARGKTLDKRTDIWSFGCVLFEALTAERAFDGDTVADILGAIVKTEPDWESIPETTPRNVREILGRCLRKDLRRRLRDMGDAWVALEEADADEPAHGVRRQGRHAIRFVSVVAAITTGLALFGFLAVRTPTARPLTITDIALPPGTQLARTGASAVAISPDGRHIAYVVQREDASGLGTEGRALYLRALDQMEPTIVDKGDGASVPFFSPDGEWLGFWSDPDQLLMKVSVSGGAAIPITEYGALGPRGASWHPDGNVLFPALGLARVPDVGGDVDWLTAPDRELLEKSHRFPAALPGGDAVLFTLAKADIESFDDASISVLSLETGEHHPVLEGGASPRFSPSGHLVYSRAGALLAIAFDATTLRVTGTPMPVLDDVSMAPSSGAADFSMSNNGTLLYAPGGEWGRSSRIVWVDRDGQSQPLVETPGTYFNLRLSPDGSRLAITTGDANTTIWVYDIRRGSMTRVAFGWNNTTPDWTPDGHQLTFNSDRSGRSQLYQIAADGSGPTEHIYPSEMRQLFASWSPDGNFLAFGADRDIWILSMEGERKAEPFFETDLLVNFPAFSPNGRWLAYDSLESGQWDVNIRPFPLAPGKWQVSTGGGRRARWSQAADEIFYRNGDAVMVVSAAETENGLTLGSPVKLFDWPLINIRDWDVTPDGQRFVMIDQGEPAPAPTRLRLIFNWGEELKRLAPRE